MAWTYFPLIIDNTPITSGTTALRPGDYQLFDALSEIPEAIRERQAFVSGARHWPPTADRRFGGVIDSIADNEDGTIIFALRDANELPFGEPDNGAYWNGSNRTGCGGSYWVSPSCIPAYPFHPSIFEVVIDYDPDGLDPYIPPRCPIRGRIVSHTNSTMTITDDMLDHITAGVLDDIQDLVGMRFYIIKEGGLWWSGRDDALSRWIAWPNDQEAWVGYITDAKMYTATDGFLKSEIDISHGGNTRWKPDQWTAEGDPQGRTYEVLAYGSDGYLWRIPITGNDENRVFFGTYIPPTVDPDTGELLDPDTGELYVEPEILYTLNASTRFTIVQTGQRGFPDRTEGYVRQWHSGLKQSVFSHFDNEEEQTGPNAWNVSHSKDFGAESHTDYYGQPTPEVPSPPCGLPPTEVLESDALDKDIYYDALNFCDNRDHYFTPHVYKTIRSWQATIEGMCENFIVPKDYDGEGAIPVGTIPRFFHWCNINAGDSVVSGPASESGHIGYYFALPSGYWNHEIYYTVETTKGDNYTTSTGVATSGTLGRIYVGPPAESGLNGLNVLWTAKWTRHYPREVRYLYETNFFIPDGEDAEGGGKAAKIPPAVID